MPLTTSHPTIASQAGTFSRHSGCAMRSSSIWLITQLHATVACCYEAGVARDGSQTVRGVVQLVTAGAIICEHPLTRGTVQGLLRASTGQGA